ncbi:hypothetical protein ABW43_13285 [Stenotrophomonas maltophilia]|nr:hypothetical protein ABW43_13285 [Stenotrophomonas maltophilia]
MVGRALRLAQGIARCQYAPRAQAVPRPCSGNAVIGQLAPQGQAGFRLQPRDDAQRGVAGHVR